MARLPTAADFGGRPIPQGGGGVVEDRSGQIAARGLAQAGEALTALGQQQMEARDRDSYARARTALLTADLETRAEEAKNPDFANSEQRYADRMAKTVGEASKLIRSNPDRAAFLQESRLDLLRGSIHVREEAWGKEVTAGVAEMNATITNGRQLYLAAKNPDDRAAILRNIQDTIASKRDLGYIDKDQAGKAMENVATDFSEGFAVTLEAKERVTYLGNKEPSAADLIPGDRRAVMLRQAQNELDAENDRALIEARQMVGYQIEDLNADAANGKTVAASSLPSEAYLKVLYGDAHGARVHQNMMAHQQAGAVVGGANQMSNSQLVAEAEKAISSPGAIGADTARIVVSNIQRIQAERLEDIGGHLVKNSPKVAEAFKRIDVDQRAYIAAVESEKERLEASAPELLPDAYVKTVTDRITQAGTAEQMLGMVKFERQRWGDFWPDVYSELAKDLPDDVMVAAVVSDQTGSTLLSMSTVKESDLAKLFPTGTTAEMVRDEINTKFSAWISSMPPDATRTTNAVLGSAFKLVAKSINENKDSETAIAHAYKVLVTDQDNVESIRGMTVRVPLATRSGVMIDPEVVSRASEVYLGTYYQPNERDVRHLEASALSPQENIANFQREVQRHGYWVTNPKATGMRLYYLGGPVSQNGEAFDVSWEQLLGIEIPPTGPRPGLFPTPGEK